MGVIIDEKPSSCCKNKKGPGYATPLDAMAGPKESLIYVTCIYSGPHTHIYKRLQIDCTLVLNI